jgi:preprotein translocase subunit SecG
MLKDLLLVLNMLVCIALIGVVLLQRSEGGAFGSGAPTGLVTARGAGDLLTRTTWVLFGLFMALSLSLTLIGGRERSSQAILERLKHTSVNPDTLRQPTPPPAQGAPSPIQLPPVGGAATPAAPAAAPVAPPSAAAKAARIAKAPKAAKPAPASAQAPPPTITAPPPPVLTPAPKPLALPPLNPASGGPTTPPSP